MLDGWHEFYELLGTAAAALLALLFVAASIGASVLTHDRAGPTRHLLEPSCFSLLQYSVPQPLGAYPDADAAHLRTDDPDAAAGSLIYSIFIFAPAPDRRHCRPSRPDRVRRIPIAAYAAGVVAAYLLLTHAITASLNVIAAASLLLLVVNIRNAWDLLIALARRATQAQPGRGDAGTPPAPGATKPPSP